MQCTLQLINTKYKNHNYIKKYKLLNQNGYLEDILTKTYKIELEEIYYYGYLQGYKIYLDNKKYPLKRGFYYTGSHLNKCLLNAIKEKVNYKLKAIK